MKKALSIASMFTFALGAAAQSSPSDSTCIANAQALLSAVASHDYARASSYFDPKVQAYVSEDALRSACSKVFAQLGEIKSTGTPKTQSVGASTIVLIPCVFEAVTLDFKVPFSVGLKAMGFTFVPHEQANSYHLPKYVDSNTVVSRDITVVSGKYKLPGKFVCPKNVSGKIPIVVLVHGSGPNDMDETIEADKPFKDLAYALAANGIGVVRYDKRTFVYGREMAEYTNFTLEQETIVDAIAAVELARKLPEADSNHVYVLGHSLGGMSAPLIAQQAGNIVAGIIIMAGNARPLEQLILEQTEYLNSLAPSHNDKAVADLKKQVETVSKGDFGPKTPSTELPLGVPADYWLFLHNYNQTKTANSLSIPILVLQGERDYQVTMTDFNIWKKTLEKHKNAVFHSYPKLNHLFTEGEGPKSTPAEYGNPANIPEYVTNDIADWVKGK